MSLTKCPLFHVLLIFFRFSISSNYPSMSILTRISTTDPCLVRAFQVRYKTSKPIPDFGKTTYVYRNLPDREKNPEFEENEYLPRRLSYWPPELPQYRGRKPVPPWDLFGKIKSYITLTPSQEEEKPEWSDVPNYPPTIRFDSDDWEDHYRLDRLKWYNKIRNLPSVEEKMYELAYVRRLYCLDTKSYHPTYNNLPITQNLTRTNLIRGLPSSINSMSDVECSKHVEAIKSHICDSLNLHYSPEHEKTLARTRRHDGREFPKSMAEEVVKFENITYDLATLATNYLTLQNPHLLKTQIDLYPSVKSSWFVGGLDVPIKHPRYRHFKQVNQPVFYSDSTVINMRNDVPIRPVADVGDEIAQTSNYKESTYHPTTGSMRPLRLKRLASSPGFMPQTGDDKEFPFLSFMSLYPLFVRRDHRNAGRAFDDDEDETESMGIMNAFSWCNSIAFHHGFSPFDEITYPFTTQNILTDGQFWTFQVYQFNTHTFHTDLDATGKPNPTRNICWTSGRMKLFEEMDENKTINESQLNEDVLKLLIQFIGRETDRAWMDKCELRPYLGEDLRTEEEKMKQRLDLRRFQAQYLSKSEKAHSKLHGTLNWEYVFGKKNPLAPDAVWLRKPYKYPHLYKLDYKFFQHM